MSLLTDSDYFDEYQNTIAKLRAELAEAKKDAERYLYLRNRANEKAKFGKLLSGGIALESAIDAAIAGEKK